MQRIRKFVFRGSVLARVAIILLITLADLSFASPSGDSGVAAPPDARATESTTEIAIDNFAFTPAAITVRVGTQVTWINHDDIPHTIDNPEGKFKSGALDTDEQFHFRFTEPGEYPFYCRLHPKMTGKIIVQP